MWGSKKSRGYYCPPVQCTCRGLADVTLSAAAVKESQVLLTLVVVVNSEKLGGHQVTDRRAIGPAKLALRRHHRPREGSDDDEREGRAHGDPKSKSLSLTPLYSLDVALSVDLVSVYDATAVEV